MRWLGTPRPVGTTYSPLDLSGLASGIYAIRVRTVFSIASTTFVVVNDTTH